MFVACGNPPTADGRLFFSSSQIKEISLPQNIQVKPLQARGFDRSVYNHTSCVIVAGIPTWFVTPSLPEDATRKMEKVYIVNYRD